MSTEASLITTLSDGAFKAEIYSTELPGEFTIRFVDGSGAAVAEETLSGVSTYRQREPEILQRLHALATGVTPPPSSELADSGEY